MKRFDYVAGFLFDSAGVNVALIEKQKPEWQRGMFNGIGGKIESGETPAQAMRREFREEAGVDVRDWKQFCLLLGTSDIEWTVHFFYACDSVDLRLVQHAEQATDERVVTFPVRALRDVKTIPNLRWLIPMALSMEYENAQSFAVRECYPTQNDVSPDLLTILKQLVANEDASNNHEGLDDGLGGCNSELYERTWQEARDLIKTFP